MGILKIHQQLFTDNLLFYISYTNFQFNHKYPWPTAKRPTMLTRFIIGVLPCSVIRQNRPDEHIYSTAAIKKTNFFRL